MTRKGDPEPIPVHAERAAKAVLDGAFIVHSELGPGLLESTYEVCLSRELDRLGIAHLRQVNLPVLYRGEKLDAGYRIDLLVEDAVIVELKAVDSLLPVHEAQLHTYLKLSGRGLGLLLNFNVPHFKQGIRRIVR